jgi:hypothetical protein
MLATSPPPPGGCDGPRDVDSVPPLPLFILKWTARWSAFSQRRVELALRLSDDASGRTIWIADAHRDDGKRFVVRAEENLSIAKACLRRDSPVTEPWRYVYLLGSARPGSYTRRFLAHPHHRIVPYDNDFTVKWRRGFGRKKRS